LILRWHQRKERLLSSFLPRQVRLLFRYPVVYSASCSRISVPHFPPLSSDGLWDIKTLHAAKPAIDEKWVAQIWVREFDMTNLGSPLAVPRAQRPSLDNATVKTPNAVCGARATKADVPRASAAPKPLRDPRSLIDGSAWDPRVLTDRSAARFPDIDLSFSGLARVRGITRWSRLIQMH
jgi:hypothetical protein